MNETYLVGQNRRTLLARAEMLGDFRRRRRRCFPIDHEVEFVEEFKIHGLKNLELLDRCFLIALIQVRITQVEIGSGIIGFDLDCLLVRLDGFLPAS